MTDKDTKRRQSGDAGEAELDAVNDAEQAQGYRGETPDPTPNEAYTVAGVTSGQPTPETDPGLREQARKASNVDGVDHEPSAAKKQLLKEQQKAGR